MNKWEVDEHEQWSERWEVNGEKVKSVYREISQISSQDQQRAFHLHDQVGQTGKSFCVLMERPGPKLSSTFFSFVLYSSAVFDNGGRKRFFFMLFGCFFDNVEETFSLLYSGLPLNIIAVLRCLSRRNLVRNERFSEAVIPRYQPDEFRSNFRLKRCTFDSLVMVVVGTGCLPLENNGSRRPVIDPTKPVLAAVWMFSFKAGNLARMDHLLIRTKISGYTGPNPETFCIPFKL